jgi:hypothetical protein
MRIALLFFLTVMSATAQTNSLAPADLSAAVQTRTNLPLAQLYEKVRMDCIQSRRSICGKIVKILPDGLVVDSGYADLMRSPIDQSWLIPGAVTATRPANLVEASQPDAICVGLVFLTDLPKTPGAGPNLYDYVNLEGFPLGQYTYESVGGIQRNVREFTTKLANAARWHLAQAEKTNAPPP